MDSAAQQIRWTCFICHQSPIKDGSIQSLDIQEKSGNTVVFIDWDYRIYLRCGSCKLCFHPGCCETYDLLELHLTGEVKEVICSFCANKADPAIKELIVNGLISSQQAQEETVLSQTEEPTLSQTAKSKPFQNKEAALSREVEHASSQNLDSTSCSNLENTCQSVESTSSCSVKCTPSEDLDSTSSTALPNIGIHIWTERQEDMLVHIRHERNDEFMKTKNHHSLWREIARELSSSLKCSISATQAMNKYYNLKKRWKEVIDSAGARGSGSESKYFRQKEAFDQMYGTKASTKPTYILDTDGNQEANPHKDQNNNAKHKNLDEKEEKEKRAQNKGKGKKRKSTDIVEILEKQNKDFTAKMEEFHRDKMARFDKLLDLYQQDVNRGK